VRVLKEFWMDEQYEEVGIREILLIEVWNKNDPTIGSLRWMVSPSPSKRLKR
jgi:hypothetical protein